MRVIHPVTGCADCPLEFGDEQVCGHPLMPTTWGDALETTRNGPPPDECPLRAGELLIMLRKPEGL